MALNPNGYKKEIKEIKKTISCVLSFNFKKKQTNINKEKPNKK